MTANPYKRKKQPERVRQTILEETARIALEKGVAGATIKAVAEASGISKGGVIHHFPNKEALLHALFQDVIEDFEQEVTQGLRQDDGREGCFTRAYVQATINMLWSRNHNQLSVLSILMLSDPDLCTQWAGWIKQREWQHRETDSKPCYQMRRLAADGLWLSVLAKVELPSQQEIQRWFDED